MGQNVDAFQTEVALWEVSSSNNMIWRQSMDGQIRTNLYDCT